jgi:preprotein translocase subunit SecA
MDAAERSEAPTPVLTPTQTYRRLSFQPPQPQLKGLDARVHSLIGRYQRRGGVLEELRREAERIDAMAPQFVELTDAQLHERLMDFRDRFRRGGRGSEDLAAPALAAIREAADRQLGLRPFLVQLMGALALHRGYLAEMATGEGKTLTAGLAGVLAGWTKRPTHIITVNDYLVQRDAEWLQPLYTVCGVRVGCVTATLDAAQRAKGYAADVTYVTSKELLADFLRDRLRLGQWTQPTRRLIRQWLSPQAAAADGLVLRGLHTAIVDEADSVLIDEAVTPLIISAPRRNEQLQQACRLAAQIAAELEPDTDYRVNARYREVELTDAGRRKLALRCSTLPGLWRGGERRAELIQQALVAREFFLRDKQYILADDKVVIVDEFTGRQMPQRTWRQGLHQAIEAKEGLPISDPAETIARLSFQRFFRCFHRLAGMTGTAWEAAGEFWQIYRLPVVRIPTNRPCLRQQWPDRFFAEEAAKWHAIAEDIQRLHATGRPILVGTRSVAASERLAARLAEMGLSFKVLNAVRHQDEAAIVALAGEPARITIATNMAGRGTDIKLGRGVAALGGLHVIATERHESRRVDRQLFGRAARQGDLGTAQAFVSAEDELIRRHLPAPWQRLLQRALSGPVPANRGFAAACFTLAQRRAQHLAYKQRAAVLRTDTWLEEALSFTGAEVA